MNRANTQSPHPPYSVTHGHAATFAAPSAAFPTLIPQVKMLLVSALYVAVLLWVYATIISPEFAYAGYVCRWPGGPAMLWLITVALLPSWFLPYALTRPSALVVWWLYLAVYIPSILVPPLTVGMQFDDLLPLQLALLLCMGLLCWVGSVRLLSMSEATFSLSLFWPIFWFVWLACFGFLGMSGRLGLMLSNLASLSKGVSEYTIRDQFGQLAGSRGALNYVPGELGHALNPFLIAYGLIYHRRLCLWIGIIGQVLIFGLTGLKGILLSGLFLALVAYLVTRWRKSFGLALTFAVIVSLIVCTVKDRASHSLYASSLFTRRTLVAPGLLTGFYFEHYSHVGPTGVGFRFSRDPAFLAPPNEIGFVYFHHADTNANANLWAEGFAELGMPGIFAFTLFTAFALWIYDSLAAKRQLVMAVLLAAMPALSVSNTAPTTVLITWGGIVAALLLYCAPVVPVGDTPEPDPLQRSHGA